MHSIDKQATSFAAAPASASSPALQEESLFIGKRILVADDNLINREISVRMLERLGCVAEAAGNGLEAVNMHRTAPFDLILMDCQMPELDGYQATEQIRALEHNSGVRTPVIALTACSVQDEQEKYTACGMDDVISKPARPQVLKVTLTRWLAAGIGMGPRPKTVSAGRHSDELEAVRAMFGADFSDLARLYQTDSPLRIALLREARAAADSMRLIKLAHAFSGSSASIGATSLSVLCRDLEKHAREGALDDFAERMAAIESEYARVSGKLRSMAADEQQ